MGNVEAQPMPTHDRNGLRIIYTDSCTRCMCFEKAEAEKEIARLKRELAALQRQSFIRRHHG